MKWFTNFKKNIYSAGGQKNAAQVLIIGLGNPGTKYETTRHNIGFLVVDELARVANVGWQKAGATEEATYTHDTKHVVLLKPQSFMNNSGQAVVQYLKNRPLPEKMIVIHDDMDLELGKVKVTSSQNTAGHNGLKSLFKELPKDVFESLDFKRLKVGVVSDEALVFRQRTPEKFVLGKWLPSEEATLQNVIKEVSGKVRDIIKPN